MSQGAGLTKALGLWAEPLFARHTLPQPTWDAISYHTEHGGPDGQYQGVRVRKKTHSRGLNGSIGLTNGSTGPPGPEHHCGRAALRQAQYLSLALKDEELADLLLLIDVILLQQLSVQPLGVFDAWHWVPHLHGGETITRLPVGTATRLPPPPPLALTCCRAAGIVMIFWMALPSLSM